VADERARHLAAAPTDLGGEAKRALLDGVSDALGEACVPKVNKAPLSDDGRLERSRDPELATDRSRIPWRMTLVPSSATPSATRQAPCVAVAKLLA
jgi:hypothetical protein